LNVLLAAALGFALAAGQAYLLDYLDDTLKSADDVERIFSAPIIGHIFEQADGMNEKRLYDTADIHNPLAEAFRALRTKIEFSEVDQPLKTILVSSADIGDGKTSVAANLAQSIAQTEKKVVLLDADLRRPNIHEYFKLANDHGLVDLFLGRGDVYDGLRFEKVRKLAVLTAGDTPPNPTELLSSQKMDQILSRLEKVSDVVIIDGPPFFVADAMILASKVDGVLLVVRPGHTRESLAKLAMEQINQVGARLVGVVLNRIPLRGAEYYAGKSHLYTYYLSNYGSGGDKKEEKIDLKKFRETLSPYVSKVTVYFQHLFKDVS
jgi:capsular exopolysaccharide synthesis family protein